MTKENSPKKNAKNKPLTHEALSVFFKELALLFESGVALGEALYIMAENSESRKKKELCTGIGQALDDGTSLSESLSASQRFPAYALQMAEIGQTSGKLDSVLEGLSTYYDRQDTLQKTVKSVLTYPLIMIAVMFCVLSILIIKVLPLFGQVFLETGAPMPLLLRLITQGNGFSTALVIILLVILLLLGLVFISAGRGLSSSSYTNSLIFRLPFMRGIQRRMDAGNFAYGMALLLAGGVPLDQCLEMTEDMASSPYAKERIRQIQESMLQGETFSTAVIQSGFLEGTFAALLAAGEKAGRTDEMMDLIADRYTDQIQNRISSILSVIEPTLVIIMSLIIGGILLSIMLPLMNIMTSV